MDLVGRHAERDVIDHLLAEARGNLLALLVLPPGARGRNCCSSRTNRRAQKYPWYY